MPELQQTHLSTHFTPTLALLAPLYLIFDSGFLLLVLSNLALHIALWQLLRWTFKETFSTLEFFPQWITRWLLPPLLAVGLGTNLFFRAVVSSGHFEVFATSLAIFALTWLWNERTRGPGVAAFVLALGVRQDAALFLFFALAALMVMQWRSPQQTRAPIRTQLALLSLCPAWLILCVKVLIPAAGGSGSAFAARYWSHYGETWPAVALAMLTQPQRLLHDLADSGFTRLFDSVAYLPALNPAAWLVSLPPAALLFTALDADKAMLRWYNSAFLLPSVLILSLLGWIRFVRFVQCIPSHGFWSFIRLKTALALVPLVVVLAFSLAKIRKVYGRAADYQPFHASESEDGGRSLRPKETVGRLMKSFTQSCGGTIESVAADSAALVFLDNRIRKLWYRSLDRADIVLLPTYAPAFRAEIDGQAPENLFDENRRDDLHVLYTGPEGTVFSATRTCAGDP